MIPAPDFAEIMESLDGETSGAPPREAFDAIGVGVTKGYELINSGELETFKVGRATRITTESLRSYVKRQLEIQTTT